MLRIILVAGLVAYASAVSYGGYCQSNSDCTDANQECDREDVCTYGYCACKDDYTYVSSACTAVTKKKVGESCSASTDVCEGDFVSCSSNVCTCDSGYSGSSGDSGCTWASNLALIGAACTNNADCEAYKYYYEQDNAGNLPEISVVTGYCSSSVCTCASGFSSADGGKRCDSNKAAYGAACTTSSDCDVYTYGSQLTCTSSTCQCASGYTQMSGYSVYDYYKDYCSPTTTTVDVAKGQTCSISSPVKSCAKGLACAVCPNDSSNSYICMDGAEHITISFVLLATALFLRFL